MKLIVGLWNPEKKYVWTRHNVGAHVLLEWLNSARNNEGETRLALEDILQAQRNGGSQYTVQRGREKIFVLFPSTYMNDSGRDVAALARMKHIAPENILVVHDDKDMEFGKVRFVPSTKKSGSGGHNGIKSIIASLGTKEFSRLKVGVANEHILAGKIDTADFVLAKFSTEERKRFPRILEFVLQKIEEKFFQ
jgi:PTH1 family peptidyl-tRNA hydrolase